MLGLGNPGPRYAHTRHNLGFRVIDAMASSHGIARWSQRQTLVRAEFDIVSTRIVLAKPQTYMNLSGHAAAELRSDFGAEPGELLVAVDDIALPLGQLRLRIRGSDGGHNGLKSVIAELGTSEFPRLRMGVGPVPSDVDPAEFVLSPFPSEEALNADAMVVRAVQCVEAWCASGSIAPWAFSTHLTRSGTRTGKAVDGGRGV